MDIVKFRGVIDYTTPGDDTVRSHLSAKFDHEEAASVWINQEESTFRQIGGITIVNRVVLQYATTTSITIARAW